MFKETSNKKILFLGPCGSYTEIAKDKFVEKYGFTECEHVPAISIRSLLQRIDVSNEPNLIGVVPIENSIDGVVRETIDNITRLSDESIKILAETTVPVSHCLITRAKSLADIHTITSYPQGIAQCRGFIGDNLNENIRIRTTDSTAQAVKELLDGDDTMAAIASENAANLYNIPILQREINDEKDNKTRFVLVGRGDTPRTGGDKTSISFSTENKPGALNHVLNILDEYKINMTYIDSRPSKRVLGEYTFYIDFDGHVKDEKIAKAMFEILQHIKFFRHLGSYESFS